MVRIEFPYPNTYMDIPESNLLGIFETPCLEAAEPEDSLIRSAIASPIGAPRLRELAYGKKSALIVCDDVARPTPALYVQRSGWAANADMLDIFTTAPPPCFFMGSTTS